MLRKGKQDQKVLGMIVMQRRFREERLSHSEESKIKTDFHFREKKPLPEPDVFRKWLCSRLEADANQPILLINGVGENWRRLKPGSGVLTACQPDVSAMQAKTFLRILVLKEIAREYSVTPWIHLLTLRDRINVHDNGSGHKGIGKKVWEIGTFLKEIFLAYGTRVNMKEDETEVERVLPTILEFDNSLRAILEQMRTPDELKNRESFGEKETVLTEVERTLLDIYLFERRMLEVLDQKKHTQGDPRTRYSLISWGLEAQAELGISYNIYDKSSAGVAILRKLVSIENEREYPGTIVLQDPLTIHGKPMRYQVQQRDLVDDETLYLSDNYANIKHKLVDQKGVSNEFLNYLTRNIIKPFVPAREKKEIDSFADLNTPSSFSKKQQLVLKDYWRFIKPYRDLVERITGLQEGLIIAEYLEPALDALGSKRNREILQKIASFTQREKDDITVDELAKEMNLEKKKSRSLYRNLEQLEECGLIESCLEGKKLRKYRIYGGATKLILKWSLLKDSESATEEANP